MIRFTLSFHFECEGYTTGEGYSGGGRGIMQLTISAVQMKNDGGWDCDDSNKVAKVITLKL